MEDDLHRENQGLELSIDARDQDFDGFDFDFFSVIQSSPLQEKMSIYSKHF